MRHASRKRYVPFTRIASSPGPNTHPGIRILQFLPFVPQAIDRIHRASMTFHMSHADLFAVTLAAVALLSILVSRYPDRVVGTHSRPDLPGPRGWPLIGNFWLLFSHSDRTLALLASLEQTYGPLFTFTVPYLGRNIVINRPEWLEHIKKKDTVSYTKGKVVSDVFAEFPGPTAPVSSDGAAWRSARKTMSPIFSVDSVSGHAYRAITEIVSTIQGLLENASKESAPVDWTELSGRIALSIFCKMAFDLSSDTLTIETACLKSSNVIADSLGVLSRISANRLFNPMWSITDTLDGTGREFNTAKSRLLDIIDKLILDRVASRNDPNSVDPGDYLSGLVADFDSESHSSIRDTLMTLLFAGRDSTQTTLIWAIYELSRSPQWIEALRAESWAAHGGDSVVPKYEELSMYPTHLAVFYETVRLWPGLPKNGRMATEDDVLPAIPEAGLPAVAVSKGDFVMWSDRNLMRSTYVWGPDAATFNPARHIDQRGQFVRPSAPRFHGFGHGPRACPARQLSAYEFVCVLSGILDKFDLVVIDPRERVIVDGFSPIMDGSFDLEVKMRV